MSQWSRDNKNWDNAWDRVNKDLDYKKLKKAFKKLLESYVDVISEHRPEFYNSTTVEDLKAEWEREAGVIKS